MAIKFTKITRANQRNLKAGEKLEEHGIIFERLSNSDGRYKINIMVDGQRIHRVVGKESEGVTRLQAEELIAKFRTDARHGRLNLPKGRKLHFTFAEAAKKYLEKLEKEGGKDIDKKTYRFDQHLIPFFGEILLNKLCTFDVERYKKHRHSGNAKAGTINRELAVISHLLNKALDWKWLDHKPCNIKRLKEDSGRIVYLTTDQVNKLMVAAKEDQCPYIYPFIVIGLSTSMRKMEILSIQLKNIDLNKRVIFIPKAKAGAREQPITQQLATFLKSYIEAATLNQEWLFPAKRSATGHVMNIEKQFRRVVTHAGLDPKEVVRHTLRHTAITHLVQAGVDLPTVQRISGHKTLQMVVRYSHQNGEHIKAAMDALEQRYNSLDKVTT
ncbi:MAG: Integrase family protein [uncultured bacterium]|nr:MAG: Integrase family protein [uncultured bacterium]